MGLTDQATRVVQRRLRCSDEGVPDNDGLWQSPKTVGSGRENRLDFNGRQRHRRVIVVVESSNDDDFRLGSTVVFQRLRQTSPAGVDLVL